jgi:hypothetical protein
MSGSAEYCSMADWQHQQLLVERHKAAALQHTYTE